MKHLALLACLLTLTWCSLSTAPKPVITDSGSTDKWAQIIETTTWSDLMSGENNNSQWISDQIVLFYNSSKCLSWSSLEFVNQKLKDIGYQKILSLDSQKSSERTQKERTIAENRRSQDDQITLFNAYTNNTIIHYEPRTYESIDYNVYLYETSTKRKMWIWKITDFQKISTIKNDNCNWIIYWTNDQWNKILKLDINKSTVPAFLQDIPKWYTIINPKSYCDLSDKFIIKSEWLLEISAWPIMTEIFVKSTCLQNDDDEELETILNKDMIQIEIQLQ